MQCKCGGSTVEKSHTRIDKGKIIAKLAYDRCSTCGNSGNFRLFECGIFTERDNKAIEEFNHYLGAKS